MHAFRKALMINWRSTSPGLATYSISMQVEPLGRSWSDNVENAWQIDWYGTGRLHGNRLNGILLRYELFLSHRQFSICNGYLHRLVHKS